MFQSVLIIFSSIPYHKIIIYFLFIDIWFCNTKTANYL